MYLFQVIFGRYKMSIFNNNKSAQSNLGRRPRGGAVAHIRRKVPIGYNGAPQIRPQKYPFLWTDPQTPLPPSSLDPSDLTASGSDPPFCHNALDKPTDRRTYEPTDRPRESLTTIGRCATRATRPNNDDDDDEIPKCFCWALRRCSTEVATVWREPGDEIPFLAQYPATGTSAQRINTIHTGLITSAQDLLLQR